MTVSTHCAEMEHWSRHQSHIGALVRSSPQSLTGHRDSEITEEEHTELPGERRGPTSKIGCAPGVLRGFSVRFPLSSLSLCGPSVTARRVSCHGPLMSARCVETAHRRRFMTDHTCVRQCVMGRYGSRHFASRRNLRNERALPNAIAAAMTIAASRLL